MFTSLKLKSIPKLSIVYYCCTKDTEGINCAVAEGTYCYHSFPSVSMQVGERMYYPPCVEV